MASLPSSVQYGTVVGQFIQAVAGTSTDSDRDPDSAPMSGVVTFTPQVSRVALDVSPNPMTMFPRDIMVNLDEQGYIVGLDNIRGVRLVASDSPGNPTNFAYTVRIALVGIAPVTFSIFVPAGATLDLTTVVPVPESSGDSIAQWQATMEAAISASLLAVEAAERAEAIPATTDGIVTDLIDNETSQTRAALKATIDGQVGAAVGTRLIDQLSVPDMISSWWSSPRMQYNAERKIMMLSGVSRNGMEGYALVDVVSGAQRFFPLRKTEADDHNVCAVLMGESLPPIIASTRHGADNLVKMTRGDYPWNPDSTSLNASVGKTTTDLDVTEATTYAHLFTKAGDTQVGLVATRSSSKGIVAFRTTDGFQTFTGPFQFLPFGYGTFRRDPGSNVIHYATVQNNPGSGSSNLQILYCKIDLATGAITSHAGVAIANLWNDTPPTFGSGHLVPQASMSDVQLYTLATAAPVRNVVRLFDVNSSSDVLVAQGRSETTETGWQLTPGSTGTARYGYGMLRRNGTSDARTSYVYEEIASTGLPTHYAQSGYYGGATCGRNRNEVFLSREESGTFYLEQWTRDPAAVAGAAGAWTRANVLATRDATKARISRPWFPNTGDASPYLMWDEMTAWDMTNFTVYQSRKRLQLIPT